MSILESFWFWVMKDLAAFFFWMGIILAIVVYIVVWNACEDFYIRHFRKSEEEE